MNFRGVRKVLVIKLRHIGDVLLTIPVFRALRTTFPDAHLTALVNAGTEDVLSGNQLIDEVLVLDRGMKSLSSFKRYKREIDFLRQIRRMGFDMTVDLTGGDRAAVVSFLSGARYRLGWRPKKGFMGKGYLYTNLSEPDKKSHMVVQNLGVVSAFGIKTEDLAVDFAIPEDDRAFVREVLDDHSVGIRDTVVHVHPTSRWLFKCWEDEYMAAVIESLLARGVTVVVTAAPETHEIGKARRILSMVKPHPKLIDLCGKTTIKQLAAVAERAQLFFGVDSAPMHIAAALNTPVVALFGPSGAFQWGPWDNEASRQGFEPDRAFCRNGSRESGRHIVIQRDWDCVPCGSDGCEGSKKSRCLEDIGVGEIRDLILARLEKAAGEGGDALPENKGI